ncbi:DUF2167 domain-containing protein [Thalassotalea mangrovi]|uniref:DUF2167 domain-containing protein n=1 Tax=Thalassotalea mangrovi TaxID=2572245 RepID=A0A4V5NWS7_9GAMM|nr:DUF2167 domain-containing protein [Thalassotalea mangrovi]TKB45555.1 DUF2167 domain-containing protein [Thalassotalea mangrovi]
MQQRILKKTLLLIMVSVAHFATFASQQDYANESIEEPQSQLTEPALSEEEQFQQWAEQTLESLTPITGTVEIADAGATLEVPEQYYFLGQKDARIVLEDIWGNPPSESVLGMLLPAGLTPFDEESWAVTIEFSNDGYVSDEDAADIDYQELLTQLQQDTQDANEQRVAAGYPAMTLLGWASKPFYDQASNKLHWAKEFSVEGYEQNTLNYNIRVLGRKGVLVLNFIAGMEQKTTIDSELENVLAMAEFDQGSRYADFNPEIDEVAAYGVGALVAGKVLAKSGFIAAAIMFLKKFGVFIVLGIGALFKKLWSRKTKSEDLS